MVIRSRESFSVEFAYSISMWDITTSVILFGQKFFILTKFETNLRRLDREHPFVE
jgi:hypothetical protein